MSRNLYTIGHSNHSIERLIELLAMHSIEALYDVRSHPYSRYNPQFNREPLEGSLGDGGIRYAFLGRELGGRSDNPDCCIDGKVGYELVARTNEFRDALKRVLEDVKSRVVALLCAEKDPINCHRAILICRNLRTCDIEIGHVLSDGEVEPHGYFEKRLVERLNLNQGDLFIGGGDDIVERAYDIQGERITRAPSPVGERSSYETGG